MKVSRFVYYFIGQNKFFRATYTEAICDYLEMLDHAAKFGHVDPAFKVSNLGRMQFKLIHDENGDISIQYFYDKNDPTNRIISFLEKTV